MGAEIFCHCQECSKPILVGEEMVSLTLSTDKVETSSFVQPIKADSIALWCKGCAGQAIARISEMFGRV